MREKVLTLCCATTAIAVLLAIGASGSSSAQTTDKRVRWARYTERKWTPALDRVRRIAMPPPLIVLSFGPRGRPPDPYQVAVRRAVAYEIAPLVKDCLTDKKLTVLWEETASSMEETGWATTDLVRTAEGTPEEVRDPRKNTWHLQMNRADLKTDPLGITTVRMVSQPPCTPTVGVIGPVRRDRTLQWNAQNVVTLGQRLNSDAVLVLQMGDDDPRGAAPILRGVWVRVRATLLSSGDGTVIWEADLQGYSQTTTNPRDFLRAGELWEKPELTLVLEGMCRLVPVLADYMTKRSK